MSFDPITLALARKPRIIDLDTIVAGFGGETMGEVINEMIADGGGDWSDDGVVDAKALIEKLTRLDPTEIVMVYNGGEAVPVRCAVATKFSHDDITETGERYAVYYLGFNAFVPLGTTLGEVTVGVVVDYHRYPVDIAGNATFFEHESTNIIVKVA